MTEQSTVYVIADRLVEGLARLDPVLATMSGVAGHDAEMSDYSPEGAEAMRDLGRATLAELEAAPIANDRDRVAKEVMQEVLTHGGGRASQIGFDTGDHLNSLNVLRSPMQAIRMVFDLMPHETADEWHDLNTRLETVPAGLASYQGALEEGMRRGLVAAHRQVEECIAQVDTWTNAAGTGTTYFGRLLDAYDGTPGERTDSLRSDLERNAGSATAAYADFARFLRDTYSPRASQDDAVGRERYARGVRGYNGTDIDLGETYAWGWEQLRWVETEMESTANRILPGAGMEAAKHLLETDLERAIDGEGPFREWMQDLQERTIADLDGVHFDLPDEIKQIEALIAPPGGALAMYYTGPSEDFARPGRTWYPTGGKTRFPLWGEVSIAYHEGVPGHHFQIATTRYLRDDLSRFQRVFAGGSGYVEGWGLYAERLMGELGYLENPDYYLGMLRAQALRSVRVIIDIGMHLELSIPRDQRFHPGETWTPDLGHEFIMERSHFPADFVGSEISRYLGVPGQAISYKVGERTWLEAREAAKQRDGADFDLKAWHNRALNLGPMGLAQMRREMAGA